MEAIVLVLLLLQAAMGGFDTIVNHEIVARLPQRPEARRELRLHTLREADYAMLFLGLALFRWEGAFAWFVAALLAAEVAVTTVDEWIENRTRLLPQNERVLHVLLTLNLGLIIAALVPVLREWGARDTALVAIERGWMHWLLVVAGVISAAWSLRDLLAVRRLGQDSVLEPRESP